MCLEERSYLVVDCAERTVHHHILERQEKFLFELLLLLTKMGRWKGLPAVSVSLFLAGETLSWSIGHHSVVPNRPTTTWVDGRDSLSRKMLKDKVKCPLCRKRSAENMPSSVLVVEGIMKTQRPHSHGTIGDYT